MSRWVVVLLVLGLVLGGCLHRNYDGGTPSPSSTTPAPSPVPNFLGNWSAAKGNFTPLLVHTAITTYNRTTNATIPTGRCTQRYTYDINLENRTLRLTDTLAIHPYDPGDLRVILLHELVLSDVCHQRGFHGVNENATTPDICLFGVEGEEREHRTPWQCRLPVMPANDAHAIVWLNVTVPLANGTYRFIANGHEFASGQSGEFTFWKESARIDRRYKTTVTVEALGLWPYSSVSRSR